jgi:hypothetical protein
MSPVSKEKNPARITVACNACRSRKQKVSYFSPVMDDLFADSRPSVVEKSKTSTLHAKKSILTDYCGEGQYVGSVLNSTVCVIGQNNCGGR